MSQEGLGTGLGSDGGHRDGLKPAAVPVNHGQEVQLSLALRQGADNVQMESLKTLIRHVQ